MCESTKAAEHASAVLLSLCAITLLACGATAGLGTNTTTTSTRRVAMNDLDTSIAKLTGLEPSPLSTTAVEYVVTGKPKYDQFFKSSAEVRATFVVSQALSEVLTENLKKYARSYVAIDGTDRSVKALIGKTAPEHLTVEQSQALLVLKKKRGKLSAEEKTFAINSVANTTQTVQYLGKTATTAKSLADSASSLSRSITTDFSGVEASKTPQVTEAVKTSVNNLREAPATAEQLAKTLARLEESLRSLL